MSAQHTYIASVLQFHFFTETTQSFWSPRQVQGPKLQPILTDFPRVKTGGLAGRVTGPNTAASSQLPPSAILVPTGGRHKHRDSSLAEYEIVPPQTVHKTVIQFKISQIIQLGNFTKRDALQTFYYTLYTRKTYIL